MYSIYATVGGTRVCLHDDTVTNSSVKVVEPVLTLEDSAAGSLTFKLAPNNIGYTDYEVTKQMVDSVSDTGEVTMKTVTETVDLVGRMQSTITVLQNGNEIWEGRVLWEEKDFYNLRNVYCEGELSYLNDTCQPQKYYHDITLRQFMEAILTIHNSRVDDSKKFYVGVVTVNDNLDISARKTEFEKTMETVNRLLEEYKGHIRVRKVNGKRYIDYLKDWPNVSTQVIQFGKNLLDFTCKWDMSELCTVVMPTGHVQQQAKSSTVGDPLVPLNDGGVPTWGQILYVDKTDPQNPSIELNEDPSLGGYCTAVYNVEENKNYYVSCRLHGGLVAYVLKMDYGGGGMTYSYKTAGSESTIGFTDFVDQKIEIPPGVKSVIVCGWDDDIPVSLKSEVAATEGLDQYLTVEDCADDGDWHQKGSVFVVNQEMVSKYGWIEKQLPLSDITEADKLYSAAKTYLSDGQFDEMTIEVSAFDLTLLGVRVDAIAMLDQVRVLSPPHNLDKLFPVTKLEIPLDKPSEQKFTLGTATEQTLTNVNNDVNEDLLSKINAVPSQTLTSAQRNAAALIASATNGFISFVNDEDGNPKEFVISNTKDPTQCTNCWVWNVNGLAHSDHYPIQIGDTVNVAMTMDGSIVADRITTGELSSIIIRGCQIVAGGMDNEDGTVLVKSGTSSGYCVELRKGGIYFGYLNQNGTIDYFGKIQDDKVYEVSPGNNVRGLVIDTKVLALDVDDVWASSKSSYSGGGTDAIGAFTGKLYAFSDPSASSIVDLNFRHGILMTGA